MDIFWLTIATLIAVLQASPISTKIKHDQRQEVIPSSAYSSGGSAYNSSVLSLLSKAIPLPYINKARKEVIVELEEGDGPLPSSEEFIESKTAPYHVDIGRSKGLLAKLYPEVGESESIIAKSPSVVLEKSHEEHEKDNLRKARAFLITVPVENEFISRDDMKNAIDGKTEDVLKKSIGLSIEAINNGLTEQLKHHTKKNGEIIEPNIKIIKLSENGDSNNLEKIDEDIKNNKNVSHAVLVAKAIKNVLLEYFKKVAETLKSEAQKNEVKVTEESKEDKKIESDKKVELNKKHDKKEIIKVNKEEHKSRNKESDKIGIKGSSDVRKDELLLLGAVNEQCGPGQERDAAGVCRAIPNV